MDPKSNEYIQPIGDFSNEYIPFWYYLGMHIQAINTPPETVFSGPIRLGHNGCLKHESVQRLD